MAEFRPHLIRNDETASTQDRETAARLQANQAPVLLWVDGLEACEFFNKAYSEFLGPVRSYDWTQFIHPEDHDRYVSAYRQALETRAPFEVQLRLRRHDGHYRWMKSAGTPRFGSEGELLGYVGCTIDITDLKKSEQALRDSEEQLCDALNQLQDKVMDLERFHDAAVGRELKMMELERQVEALKAKVQRLQAHQS
jgi:PAS domain S-box-containing protein